MKTEQVKLELENILKSDASEKYTALAKEILITNTPVPVVAALLKRIFQSAEKESYAELQKASPDHRDREQRNDRRSDRKWHGRRGRRR